ncbi:MAG: hypothetical protein R6U04_08705 [Bacteroidales bacterium]
MINKIIVFLLLLMFNYWVADAYSQNDKDSIALTQGEVDRKRNAISTFNMFQEPSHILFGSGIGNLESLIFEADIAPYFMLSISESVRWGVELSPRIIIRMYNRNSYPIRTPSFMPKITFFHQFLDKEDSERDLFTYISAMHHSNGQEGDFFNNDSTTINTLTGNFSTNWIEGGVFLSRPNDKLLFNTNYVNLYAMYNYKQEEALSGTYGRLRFFVNVKSTVKLSEAFGIIVAAGDQNKKYVFDQSIQTGWITGKLNDAKTLDIKRLSFNYSLSFTPTFLKHANIFIQYYYGQDYYNIHFDRQIKLIRFGISARSGIL